MKLRDAINRNDGEAAFRDTHVAFSLDLLIKNPVGSEGHKYRRHPWKFQIFNYYVALGHIEPCAVTMPKKYQKNIQKIKKNIYIYIYIYQNIPTYRIYFCIYLNGLATFWFFCWRRNLFFLLKSISKYIQIYTI